MTKTEKIQDILTTLDRLYPEPKAPLSHKDAYTLLISVLLSARCTDKTVNRITPLLFNEADNPYDMVMLPVEKIQSIIRPCGLSLTKAKGIAGTSRILIDQHQGQVPDTFDELEALPAVGHKTASVVMSQWFHKPALPVDTHIHRLAYRWGLSSGKSVERTERDLKRLFPQKKWNKIHLQFIYFGREFCTAKKHVWTTCPLCKSYLRSGLKV